MACHLSLFAAVLLLLSRAFGQSIENPAPANTPGRVSLYDARLRNLEYGRIQCDDDPVPFNISLKYSFRQEIGDYPRIFPKTGVWKPLNVTAQKLCALQEYGGYGTLQSQSSGSGISIDAYILEDLKLSLRGTCAQFIDDLNYTTRNYWPGNFPMTPPDQNTTPQQNPSGIALDLSYIHNTWNDRLRLYCRDHCYCSRAWDAKNNKMIELTERPKGYDSSYAVIEYADEWGVSEIDITSSIKAGSVKRVSHKALLTGLLDKSFARTHPAHHAKFITLAPKYHVKCSAGEPADMPVPPPYTSKDFDSIIAMCAVALSGGDPGANAGAYCYHPTRGSRLRNFFRSRSRREEAERPELWFADDMTPRPEWRWANNFRQSIIIRHYCWRNCWCAHEIRTRRRKMRKLWLLFGGLDLIEMTDGSTQLAKRESSSSSASVTVTPAQWKGQTTQQRSCVVEGVDYCKAEPWPVDSLGPPPPANPAHPSGLYPVEGILDQPNYTRGPGSSNLGMCGESCDGPASQTCSGGQDSSCKCTVLNPQLAHIFGLDPVATSPLALCINIAFAAAKLAEQRGQRGQSALLNGLGGRGLDLGPLEDLSCPCNGTYVSKACCFSTTGLVWESAEIKALKS